MEEKDEKKFEIEGQPEENEEEQLEEDFEEDYEEERRGPWVYILLVLFIVLFLSATSLLTYFQFYQGKVDGKHKFEFSLEKKTTSASADQALVDENKELKAKLDSLLNTEIADTSVDDYMASEETDVFEAEPETPPTTSYAGEKFHVQIGAYSSFPFKNYGNKNVVFKVESIDGLNKIVIGSFDSFDDACAFRKDLMNLGLSGAFIVKTKEGQRVNFDRYCP
jgi:cell division protein FtsN